MSMSSNLALYKSPRRVRSARYGGKEPGLQKNTYPKIPSNLLEHQRKQVTMFGLHSLAALVLLVVLQNSWQIPLKQTENGPRSEIEHVLFDESRDSSNMKRHSDGTFSNDYSKYQEDLRAKNFVQWLLDSKRNGDSTKRHAEGTYTSDVSAYLQDQAAKDFVSWLKSGHAGPESAQVSRANGPMNRRHVDGSFTSDVNKVLDSMAAKEYLLWVMTSKPSGNR
ncbi:hypothetical protein DPEC_G00148740 [Dallia pectoralis]|uniref:Uncharacterized protein n=1 Tax=Dallia pectoralis TaxID=75939 RepID=A0ACC2GIE8_DALPE|nr:hypothetical protein DPEC_G00148740 [Dallia pectoralis]